jgi:osmotically-inducible protein OsmY
MDVLYAACTEKELAERRLRGNPYLALKNVSCDSLDGMLILRGCVPSYYLKQIAQQAVASLEGVERIDNQIEVISPSSAIR